MKSEKLLLHIPGLELKFLLRACKKTVRLSKLNMLVGGEI